MLNLLYLSLPSNRIIDRFDLNSDPSGEVSGTRKVIWSGRKNVLQIKYFM